MKLRRRILVFCGPDARDRSSAEERQHEQTGGGESIVGQVLKWPIDINRATATELKALPGIGDAYSAAIIKNRPYANKRQILLRKVIPQGTYDRIASQIIDTQKK